MNKIMIGFLGGLFLIVIGVIMVAASENLIWIIFVIIGIGCVAYGSNEFKLKQKKELK